MCCACAQWPLAASRWHGEIFLDPASHHRSWDCCAGQPLTRGLRACGPSHNCCFSPGGVMRTALRSFLSALAATALALCACRYSEPNPHRFDRRKRVNPDRGSSQRARFPKDPMTSFGNIIGSGLGDTFSERSGHDPGPNVQAQCRAPLAGGKDARRRLPSALH